jgi:hypothetical protein
VAQSSADASLITIGTLAVCEFEVVLPELPELKVEPEPEDPPPQAVSAATIAPQTA